MRVAALPFDLALAVMAFLPTFAATLSVSSVSLVSAPVLLSAFAPALVYASRGKPLYNPKSISSLKPLPFTPSTNWTKEPEAAHGPKDRQFTAKKGIVYQRGGDSEASEFTNQQQVGWAYNWGPNHGALAGNIEIVPMLWTLYTKTTNGDDMSEWNYYTESNAEKTPLLGYNEPDLNHDGGSDSSPIDAARDWKANMQVHGQYQNDRAKFYLGSPAVAAGSWDWMDAFEKACDNCEFDFFAVHWYGSCNVNDFIGYLQEYKRRYMGAGQPMWVTEFGGTDPNTCTSPHAEAQFIIDAVNWMEGQDWIERYAYWGNLGTGKKGGMNTFLNSDNSWSCQGVAYMNGNLVC